MDKKELRYFNKAKQASHLSIYDRVRIGCVAVYKKNIIAIGFNKPKTDPMQVKYSLYRIVNNMDYINHHLHAEMDCINQIRNMDIDFKKVKLFVYREDDKENMKICKPCGACEKAIRDLGIKKVYYTDTNKYVREDYV